MSNPKFGSLEVFYTFPSDTLQAIEMSTNVKGLKQYHTGPKNHEAVTVRVSSIQDALPVYIQVETLLGDAVVDRSDWFTYQEDDSAIFAVRIFFFDQFISVTVNDVWAYSYALSEVQYQETTEALLRLAGGTITITDMRKVELSDGREAVYVDYESTTDSAIQSIIQQRPVQVLPSVDRATLFTYDAEKSLVPVPFVHSVDIEEVRPPGLSSDGLVYADEVGISIDEETAREVGLITRLYRLSELSTGYERATAFLQKQARQRRKPSTVVMRLDPRVELTDILDMDLYVTSTGRHLLEEVIVEDISLSMRDGDYSMTIKGRKR